MNYAPIRTDIVKRTTETSRQVLRANDATAKSAAVRAMFGVPQAEFNRRVRFRDRAGYRYAVPRKSNTLYRNYVQRRMINPLDDNEDDDEEHVAEEAEISAEESGEEESGEGGTVGRARVVGVSFRRRRTAARRPPLGLTLGGKSMLFTRKPRTRALPPTLKPGTIVRLLDMRSKNVYEARVELFLQRGLEASGHAILRDIVAKGPLLDPLEFAVDVNKATTAQTKKHALRV
jgi:hypothetical protein